MAEIQDIGEFIKEAKKKELQQFTESQLITINKLQDENNLLKQKLGAMERMLVELEQRKVSYNSMPDEELICIEQIQVLKTKSSSRELSLDEAKRLDLFIKNLRLIREQSTEVINSADYRDLGEEALVRIASSTTED
jgi:hypothetical protein